MLATLVLLTAVSFSESVGATPAEAITLPETVITAPSHNANAGGTRASNAKVWVCEAEWQASQVGGSYKRCEWVKRGSEPRGF